MKKKKQSKLSLLDILFTWILSAFFGFGVMFFYLLLGVNFWVGLFFSLMVSVGMGQLILGLLIVLFLNKSKRRK